MRNEVSIVTALYNLPGVSRIDRTWDNYLLWFSKTLQLRCPFVVFIEQPLKKIVQEYRNNMPTEIITQPLEEIPYFNFNKIFQDILNSTYYNKKMSDIRRVECKYALYLVIIYSKFKWLINTVKLNPFKSEFFLWLDAGASRFFENYDFLTEYPSKKSLEYLKSIKDTVLTQYNTESYKDLCNADKLNEDYFWDNRSFISTGIFGGNKKAIQNLNQEIDNVLQFMVENKCLNNEQIALGYLYKKHSNLFTGFYRKNGRTLQLFEELI